MRSLIERVFSNVSLGTGVSLRESHALDHRTCFQSREAARALDEVHDWRRVVDDPELVKLAYIGGLCFYDPEGMRFHLPAYLTLAVTRFEDPATSNILEVLMNNLTARDIEIDARFSLLTASECNCVGAILAHLQSTYELDAEVAAAAETWLRMAEARR